MRAIALGAALAVTAGAAQAAVDFPRWSEAVPSTSLLRPVTFGSADGSVVIAAVDIASQPWVKSWMRSTDAGATWRPMAVDGKGPYAVVGSPSDPAVLYATTGFRDQVPDLLHRSDDGGATWYLVAEQLVSAEGAALELVAVGADPSLLYGLETVVQDCMDHACSYTGMRLHVSTNAGVSWRSIDGGLKIRRAWPSPSDAGVVYAASSRDLYRSLDQGRSWVRIREGVVDTAGVPVDPWWLAVDARDSRLVYAAPWAGTLRATDDGGATWRDPALPFGGSQIRVDPSRSGHLYAIGREGELFHSADAARSWRRALPAAEDDGGERAPTFLVAQAGERRVLLHSGATGLHRAELGDGWVLGRDFWWNPAEPGWGLSLTQHASGQLFAVWFTYDERGEPTWFVMPGGQWSDGPVFSATLYTTRGYRWFPQPLNVYPASVIPVGTATIRFVDENRATFSYRLDAGPARDVAITRQLYGSPSSGGVGAVADVWYVPEESGWGFAAGKQYGQWFGAWFIHDEAGRPTWLVVPNGGNGESSLYRTRGPALGNAFDPARVTVEQVGYVKIAPRADGTADFTYSAFGHRQTRRITRQPF